MNEPTAASVCDCPDFKGPVDTRHVCPVHGPLYADDGDAAPKRGTDKTPWPRELMHAELCAWRFGGKCDCGKDK